MDHLFYILSSFKLSSTIKYKNIFTVYSSVANKLWNVKPLLGNEMLQASEADVEKCVDQSECLKSDKNTLAQCAKCVQNCCQKFGVLDYNNCGCREQSTL